MTTASLGINLLLTFSLLSKASDCGTHRVRGRLARSYRTGVDEWVFGRCFWGSSEFKGFGLYQRTLSRNGLRHMSPSAASPLRRSSWRQRRENERIL